MHTSLKTSVWFIGGLATLSCQPLTESGPEPFRPQFYSLVIVDDKPLPQQYFPEGNYSLVGGKLAPYAVGRTIDQRLVNDRGGRGSTGGNTRDTTVLRGQFLERWSLQLGAT